LQKILGAKCYDKIVGFENCEKKNNREKQRETLNSAFISRYFSRQKKRLETLAREPPSSEANALLLRAQQNLYFKPV